MLNDRSGAMSSSADAGVAKLALSLPLIDHDTVCDGPEPPGAKIVKRPDGELVVSVTAVGENVTPPVPTG